jgi:hypothetical protein
MSYHAESYQGLNSEMIRRHEQEGEGADGRRTPIVALTADALPVTRNAVGPRGWVTTWPSR